MLLCFTFLEMREMEYSLLLEFLKSQCNMMPIDLFGGESNIGFIHSKQSFLLEKLDNHTYCSQESII